MDKVTPKTPKKPTLKALNIIDNEPSEFDPLGMYTGVPSVSEVPQQDQDDL